MAMPLAALDAPPGAPVPAEALRRAAQRARPVSLAAEQTLCLHDALEGLLPSGLRRGSVVAVEGGGATSLALALGAAATAAGSWAAAVGFPSLGLLAAGELGVALERLVLIDPPPAMWPTTVAALLDAVDIVYAAPPGRVRPGDARRLAARARERGAVLVPLTTAWPMPPDVRLTVTGVRWEGPCDGAGRLTARRLEVLAGGRGAASRPRQAVLWLPDEDGGLRRCGPADVGPHADEPHHDVPHHDVPHHDVVAGAS